MTALPLAVSPDLRRRAITVAVEVADRLRSPEPVAASARRARRPAGHPVWDASSLLLGHPGVALLHATMSVADPSWAAATHAHMAAASGGAGADLVPAAVLHGSVHGGYPKLLRTLAEAVAVACTHQVEAQARRVAHDGPGLAVADYDVVSGLAGKGRLLLALGDDRSSEALHTALGHLVACTRPVTAHDAAVPGWWCRPGDCVEFPQGYLDVGLAHGIAGPLALMALAHDRGHRVEGMPDAMRTIVDWLLRRAVRDEHGPMWPSRIGFAQEIGDEPVVPDAVKAAWCYGTAGVARALHLAGIALGDRMLCATAVQALRGAALRPWSEADLVGPTICHGAAGLLQVVLRVSERDPDPVLLNAAGLLAQRVLYDLDRTAPFGFRHAHRTRAGRVVGVDEPGLLQGAAGVALVLATFAHHPGTVGPDVWDAPLMLS
ncbi:lanthionine synthetase-like protein [Pseudonocardia hierapolitana]|uniref:Lanthionine synthetase-like protein n=1 Tax=Pseudonocardia hierapolitana TaxID=1128676 RepID=A0A561SVR4_9PSEU|nr:lanthionine synthetase C family protein [Pseudonocardia hierapolitana]TWF78954.1 lanthionine synthetase-like protein [Pseudonocardia hierapolitana]